VNRDWNRLISLLPLFPPVQNLFVLNRCVFVPRTPIGPSRLNLVLLEPWWLEIRVQSSRDTGRDKPPAR
jgi:hypothetical protein